MAANRVNLCSDDLILNQQGVLSGDQLRLLRQQRWVYVAGTAVFLLLLLLFPLALLLKLQFPAFANKGQLFLFFPVGLFWLWLLRHAPRQWQSINQDITARNVAFVDGPVHPIVEATIGLVQLMKYKILVADHQFSVQQEICFQFKQGHPYRVYFSPRSQVFLGAMGLLDESIEKTEPIALKTAESLTPRELELLRLVAAGLSNKEIAAQLSLSVNTVKMYTSQLYQKLGVRRRTEAVKQAQDLGIL